MVSKPKKTGEPAWVLTTKVERLQARNDAMLAASQAKAWYESMFHLQHRSDQAVASLRTETNALVNRLAAIDYRLDTVAERIADLRGRERAVARTLWSRLRWVVTGR
jgi:hypothetical protein